MAVGKYPFVPRALLLRLLLQLTLIKRYLPSAALARKRLLEHMQLIESLAAAPKDSCPSSESRPTSLVASDYSIVDLHPKEGTAVKWSQIYSVSYSQSLTGCVKQLDQLCKYTKQIVGEQGYYPYLNASHR